MAERVQQEEESEGKRKVMKCVPVSLKQANEFIEEIHRHHKAVQGHKFSIGVVVGGETTWRVRCWQTRKQIPRRWNDVRSNKVVYGRDKERL